MEVKEIINQDRNKIVPSYEYRDYYREDGSHLYNSNREANWYKIGIKDCFDYFEQNRLKACDNLLDVEFEREADFICNFVKKYHRTPTISDAIEETKKQMIDKACKWLKSNIEKYYYRDEAFDQVISIKNLSSDFIKAMEE